MMILPFQIIRQDITKMQLIPSEPSKQTAVAFAIAQCLNLDETQDLLTSAGLTYPAASLLIK